MSELTMLGDSSDLNNSVWLILRRVLIAGLVTMLRWGAAIALFIFCHTLNTSKGNIICFGLASLGDQKVMRNRKRNRYFLLVQSNLFRQNSHRRWLLYDFFPA